MPAAQRSFDRKIGEQATISRPSAIRSPSWTVFPGILRPCSLDMILMGCDVLVVHFVSSSTFIKFFTFFIIVCSNL